MPKSLSGNVKVFILLGVLTGTVEARDRGKAPLIRNFQQPSARTIVALPRIKSQLKVNRDGSSTDQPGRTIATPNYRLQIGRLTKIGTSAASYLDPEIQQQHGMMAWIDGVDNTVWVCRLDPNNGDLVPSDGRGTRIGTAAPFIGDWIRSGFFNFGERGTLNGPEWGLSRDGLGVYFTIKDEAGVYQQAKCLLSDLKVTQLTFGGVEDRHGNLASQDENDERTRIGYYQNQGRNRELAVVPAYWQYDLPGEPQHQIPLEVFSFNGPRWFPARQALLTYLTAPDGTTQVVEYNIQTGAKTFLTTGPEPHLDGQIVVDPETSAPKYLICMETLQAIAIYEWTGSAWEKQRTVRPPDISAVEAPNFRVTGPRPFIVNGRLFFLYYVINGFNPVVIYLASGDGLVSQRLIEGTLPVFQIDPEVFIGNRPNEIFAYFYSTFPMNPLHRLGSLFRVNISVLPPKP